MTIFDLRPFGRDSDDLDIDFGALSRIQLVTQILQRCAHDAYGQSPTSQQLNDLEVGTRIEWLLTILARSEADALTIVLTCANDACQQMMEVEISLTKLAALNRQAIQDAELKVELQNLHLTLRKPKGSDQLRWQACAFDNEKQAQRALLWSLVVGEHIVVDEQLIEESDLRLVDEAMRSFDPLVSFRLVVDCPYCEEQHDYPVDLQGEALSRLHQKQALVLEFIHRLAYHYHWSEAQILAMPEWRCARYLAMIEQERD
jgi:hypothetical protein